MTSVLGNLQLPPASATAMASEAMGRPINSQATIQARPQLANTPEATEKKVEKKPIPIVSDETHLAYTLDDSGNKLMVKITNQVTGELVRTLEFKNFTTDAHTLSKLAGHLVDHKT
jgi:uncharacterized FlaG/YvyC family protein